MDYIPVPKPSIAVDATDGAVEYIPVPEPVDNIFVPESLIAVDATDGMAELLAPVDYISVLEPSITAVDAGDLEAEFILILNNSTSREVVRKVKSIINH